MKAIQAKTIEAAAAAASARKEEAMASQVRKADAAVRKWPKWHKDERAWELN